MSSTDSTSTERRRRAVCGALLAAALLIAASAASAGEPTFIAELEAGPVWQSRNDVQIPNDETGTRFSLVDFAGSGPWFAARLYLTLTAAERHQIRLLLAPLSIRPESELDAPVDFAGTRFEPGIPTTATYRFNSWRLTYRYRMRDTERFAWWLGFTAKIRDAKIELEQEGISAAKTDVGFVPLLHLAARYRPAERWSVLLDLDALAGGPGRAEDFSAKVSYDLSAKRSLSFGYRTVEGGADVDEVYNFAWLHYLVLSLEERF
jgi:hypothetical protein